MEPWSDEELLRTLVWAFGALAALQSLRLWWFRKRLSRRSQRRLRRALAGERAAADLLCAAGYEVLDAQVPGQYALDIDGEPETIGLRADYLVRAAGRLLVAEVKTGMSAPDPHHAPTRRQLLEYRLAFPIDGVLLVDMHAGRVCEVDFPFLATGPGNTDRPRRWPVLLFATLAATCAYYGLVP